MKTLDDAVQQLVRDHAIATERLTEVQLVSAIKQAIASGDFLRVICNDNRGQTVIYMPFHGHDALRSRVRYLEQLLADNKINIPLDYQ